MTKPITFALIPLPKNASFRICCQKTYYPEELGISTNVQRVKTNIEMLPLSTYALFQKSTNIMEEIVRITENANAP